MTLLAQGSLESSIESHDSPNSVRSLISDFT